MARITIHLSTRERLEPQDQQGTPWVRFPPRPS
jgi:hypothetical protein